MDVISPSGPFVSLRHADEQIPLLIHMPQTIPLEYPNKPLWSLRYGATFDAIKAATGDSD
jgi:hypothetical protein